MFSQELNSSTSGLRYFDIESSQLDLNKKRKRSHFYRKPTDVEYSALALLKLSRSGQSFCNRPISIPDTVEAVECKNPVTVATTTTARMATSAALGNVENIEHGSTVIIASPLAQYAPYGCTMYGESFSSYQALDGSKKRHRHRPLITTTNSNTLKISAPNPSGRIHQCSARMATSALGNVENIESGSTVIIASPLAQYASYACTMCGESFSSYQALGGHKTRHRHRPLITSNNSNTIKVSAPNPSGRIHQCFKCNEVFNTGQALGGHMRRHYDGVIGGGKKTNVITSEGGDSSDCNSNGRTPHDFDLNLPASPETCLGLTLYCSENF
ncbi:unnamed protein product [Fraxinus pennsylvanica]|uniref:C2H2-type domain-containing protein n=1 Tax=Fraxinus pennsylvanica TaxID=56036 RepID=A0AAD1Z782_9LAMI|nr:unnamed protein product [Fraxinus pennsylvanica]